MSDQNPFAAPDPFQPAPQVLRPAKSSRWLLWSGLGCGGILFLLVMCAGGLGWMWWQTKSKAQPVTDAFLATIEQEDYVKAYDLLGKEWKSIQSEQEFTQFEQRLREILGPVKTKTFQFLATQKGPQGSSAVLTYSARYAKSSGRLIVTLMNNSGEWRVVGHRIESPAFQQALKCPHCGRTGTTLGRFCPSCGKPLETTDPPPPR